MSGGTFVYAQVYLSAIPRSPPQAHHDLHTLSLDSAKEEAQQKVVVIWRSRHVIDLYLCATAACCLSCPYCFSCAIQQCSISHGTGRETAFRREPLI